MKKLVLALAALALPSAVSAHVVLNETTATAGGYHAAVFRVGHGCGDAATTALTIHLPADTPVPRAQPKAGWTLEVQHAPLDPPVTDHGVALTERVASLTWRGRLPSDQFDDFAVLLKLPEAAGDLVLPVTQTCGDTVVEWDAATPDHPAPVLHLTAADAPMSMHHH